MFKLQNVLVQLNEMKDTSSSNIYLSSKITNLNLYFEITNELIDVSNNKFNNKSLDISGLQVDLDQVLLNINNYKKWFLEMINSQVNTNTGFFSFLKKKIQPVYQTTNDSEKILESLDQLFLQLKNKIVVEKEKVFLETIPILDNTFTEIKINNVYPIKIPTDKHYGHDWPSELAKEFTVPNLNVKDKKFIGIQINAKVHDQGFGGTGQVCVRGFINENATVPFFWVDREKIRDPPHPPHPHYSALILSDMYEIKEGDIIKIWLCCPPWAAWTATMKSLEVSFKFE